MSRDTFAPSLLWHLMRMSRIIWMAALDERDIEYKIIMMKEWKFIFKFSEHFTNFLDLGIK